MDETFQGADASLETVLFDIPDRIGHMYLDTSRAHGQAVFFRTIFANYRTQVTLYNRNVKACTMFLGSGYGQPIKSISDSQSFQFGEIADRLDTPSKFVIIECPG